MVTEKRAHIFVSGRVQGVFFRDFTSRQARSLKLKGWVRNLSDGRVEVVAEGEEDKLKILIEQLKKGPPGAKVTNIEVMWEVPTGEFGDFHIEYF